MKRRKKRMITIGVILCLIGGVIIYWNIPFSPFKEQFNKSIHSRIEMTQNKDGIWTAEDISNLPEVLQQYCDYLSLEGKEKQNITHTYFTDTQFVMNATTNKKITMDYDLWLFNDEPYRSAYCQSSMFGIPFDGMDYCNDNKEGGMKGFLAKTVQIFDMHNEQGYRAGLISWFAESLTFNPSVLFSPYVKYETIDDLHLKVIISYKGIRGTGIITFDDEGKVIEFYSDDRQVEMINGVETIIGWKCEYLNYMEDNNIKQAHTIRCIKVFPDKEVVYFDSDQVKISYVRN